MNASMCSKFIIELGNRTFHINQNDSINWFISFLLLIGVFFSFLFKNLFVQLSLYPKFSFLFSTFCLSTFSSTIAVLLLIFFFFFQNQISFFLLYFFLLFFENLFYCLMKAKFLYYTPQIPKRKDFYWQSILEKSPKFCL